MFGYGLLENRQLETIANRAESMGPDGRRTLFHENLQEACFVIAETSRNLREPPGTYGIL